MESNIFLLVIFAAILHAIWNGMVKNFGDKVISVSAIVFGHVPIAIIVMLFLPLPTLESVPYIILSAIIHQGYQYNLISAYKIGDLTKVYPIARGTGPIVATLISIIFLGLLITKFQTLSIVLICLGIIILGMFSENSIKNNKAIIYSLATGFFIGLYSLADGIGHVLKSSGDVSVHVNGHGDLNTLDPISEAISNSLRCPECSNSTLHQAEGCYSCVECGYSRCG